MLPGERPGVVLASPHAVTTLLLLLGWWWWWVGRLRDARTVPVPRLGEGEAWAWGGGRESGRAFAWVCVREEEGVCCVNACVGIKE